MSGRKVLPRRKFQSLLNALMDAGYQVIGPTVDQEAIVFRPIEVVEQLPKGWSDEQAPGKYRLYQTGLDRFFYYNASPDSWKRLLFPPRHELSRAFLDDQGWHFETPKCEVLKYAFLGVRSCDLAAIAIQDRVFHGDDYVDPAYKQRRDAAMIIAVNCSTANSTCFCTSMNTGPCCGSGFDLAITELESEFVIESGSQKGESILSQLETRDATSDDCERADRESERAKEAITKRFRSEDVHDLLLENLEHPQWLDVAERCLSCANCTMACPTCFCSTVEEVSDLKADDVSRVRQWDTCFNIDLSYTAGGTVRDNTRSRYRQWLTHKLATWQDQFDVSGCTGCGRCITWCPVGIDLTQEVAAIREDVEKSTTAQCAGD